jgi:Flp pilus assembly protein TadD
MIDLTDREKLAKLHQAAKAAGADAVDPDVLLASAQELMRLSSWEKAAQVLDGALVIDPENAEAWSLRGAVAERMGESDKARRFYLEALSRDDRDPSAAVSLAAIYARTGDEEHARALLNWLLLEEDVPEEARKRAIQIKQGLGKGARS